MKRLVWDGAKGFVVNGAVRLTLAAAPSLGFPFDAISYDDSGTSAKVVAGQTMAIADADVSAITTFIGTFATVNATALVWGVDANGVLLGLVARSAAFAVTPEQPKPASAYRWDFARRTWISTLNVPVDAGAVALDAIRQDIAALATQFAEMPTPLVLATTTSPMPEAPTPQPGDIGKAADAGHVHPRASTSVFGRFDASGLATISFTTPFDARPSVTPTVVVPAGQMPAICVIQSFVMASGKYSGVIVKGYRLVLLPTLTVTSLLTSLSAFNVFNASAASGLEVSVLAVKSSSPS